jgi:hypothetical protein
MTLNDAEELFKPYRILSFENDSNQEILYYCFYKENKVFFDPRCEQNFFFLII